MWIERQTSTGEAGYFVEVASVRPKVASTVLSAFVNLGSVSLGNEKLPPFPVLFYLMAVRLNNLGLQGKISVCAFNY